jgi:hypothetical protein
MGRMEWRLSSWKVMDEGEAGRGALLGKRIEKVADGKESSEILIVTLSSF